MLQNTGVMSSRGEAAQQGSHRRYESITEQGRGFLKELENSWDELTSAVNSIKENHNN